MLLAAALLWRSWWQGRAGWPRPAWCWLACALTTVKRIDDALAEVMAISRNFYVVRVREYGRDHPQTHVSAC